MHNYKEQKEGIQKLEKNNNKKRLSRGIAEYRGCERMHVFFPYLVMKPWRDAADRVKCKNYVINLAQSQDPVWNNFFIFFL